MSKHDFVKEIAEVINKYSRENESDTPDFILAEFLVSVLEDYELAVKRREIHVHR